MLFNLIRRAGKEAGQDLYITNNPYMECAYYPNSKILLVINNSDSTQTGSINTESGPVTITLEAYESKKIEL